MCDLKTWSQAYALSSTNETRAGNGKGEGRVWGRISSISMQKLAEEDETRPQMKHPMKFLHLCVNALFAYNSRRIDRKKKPDKEGASKVTLSKKIYAPCLFFSQLHYNAATISQLLTICECLNLNRPMSADIQAR